MKKQTFTEPQQKHLKALNEITGYLLEEELYSPSEYTRYFMNVITTLEGKKHSVPNFEYQTPVKKKILVSKTENYRNHE